jgi:hypothetical protein
MKLPRPSYFVRRGQTRRQPARRGGAAVIMVLVLIAAMSLIVVANATSLHWLKREILRIEERQQRVRHRPVAIKPIFPLPEGSALAGALIGPEPPVLVPSRPAATNDRPAAAGR